MALLRMRIGIVMGHTRPGRTSEAVARWVLNVASQRNDADFELIDIAQYVDSNAERGAQMQ